MEVPWARIKLASLQPGMYLSEPELRRYRRPSLIGSFNPAAAGKIFADAPASFEQLAALSDAHLPLPHFPLTMTLHAEVATTHAVVKADNVVAELPGSDPRLAEQAVVLSAHLDHLGTGKPDHGDGIFHGAMDNASGVASLLEVARALQASGVRPKRSILFVAVGGEEKGLLGSRYFAAHPTRHVGELVADINMDMFLPLFPLHRLVAYGADESSLGGDAVAIAKSRGLTILPDPAPDHLIFVRSDQYSFIRRGVPALMVAFAATPGTDEDRLKNAWFQERYHAQADDLQQPIDLAAADEFNRYLVDLISRVANQPRAPVWRDASFFRRFAQSPMK
jgi:Zn-dependent M28 family amino/carboxypeptidase